MLFRHSSLICPLQYWEKELEEKLHALTGTKYVKLSQQQLVGVYVVLFVKAAKVHGFRGEFPIVLYEYSSPHLLLPGVQSLTVKLGVGRVAGNKGAVIVKCNYLDSTFAFVCAHLAAGKKKVEDRNMDYREIVQQTVTFGSSNAEHYFFFGDLNYRIDRSNEEVRQLVAEVRNGCARCA